VLGLQDGNLTSTEKERQIQSRVENMKKDVQSMIQSLEGRLENRFANIERGELQGQSNINDKIVNTEKKIVEAIAQIEKKIYTVTDEKAADTRRKFNESLSKAVESVRQDYQQLVNKVQAQISELESLGSTTDLDTMRQNYREMETRVWNIKHDVDDNLKSTKLSIMEDLKATQATVFNAITESETKTQKDFSKLLNENTEAIEHSVNNNLIPQMKDLDIAQQELA